MDGTIRLSSLHPNITIPTKVHMLDRIECLCRGFVLIEIQALPHFAEYVFTTRETAKAESFGARRRKSFTAARVALKTLARKLDLVEAWRQEYEIETLSPDGMRPILPACGIYCSVSHDNVFVVAVAHDRPIGVDIEPISDRAIKGWHIFMSPPERDLILNRELRRDQTVARAWTMKEAAAKALGLGLVQSWREVRIIRIGNEKSLAKIQDREISFEHIEIQGHVLSLITFNDD